MMAFLLLNSLCIQSGFNCQIKPKPWNITIEPIEYISKSQAARVLKVSDFSIRSSIKSGKLLKSIWLISIKETP